MPSISSNCGYYSFSSYLQSLVFPRVVNILKYRKTFDLGLLLFAISSIIFPFSNQISGHIPVQQFNFTGSGSGMMDTSIPFCGPGSIMDDKSNSTDIIGNPITRVPARVWAVIMIITTIQILGRFVDIFYKVISLLLVSLLVFSLLLYPFFAILSSFSGL